MRGEYCGVLLRLTRKVMSNSRPAGGCGTQQAQACCCYLLQRLKITTDKNANAAASYIDPWSSAAAARLRLSRRLN